MDNIYINLMDIQKEFNEVLNYALSSKGIMFRKDGKYLCDAQMSEIEFNENLIHKGYDYFTIFTKNGQLVEYIILLGKIGITGELDAHNVAKNTLHIKQKKKMINSVLLSL